MSRKKTNLASNHAKYVANDPVRKFLLKRFLQQITSVIVELKPKTIIDAGCGEGFVLQHLHAQGVKAYMGGVDLSKTAVNIAKKQLPYATFTTGSVYKLPYKDSSADLVICTEVLEHLNKPENALSELKRVSSRYVICSVPHEPWFMLGSLLGGKYISRLGNHPEHVNHWTAWGFRRFLMQNGLVIRKFLIIRSFPWLLGVCEKKRMEPDHGLDLRSLVLDLKDAQHDVRNSNLNEFVMKHATGTTFLDVGCGVGNLVNLATKGGFNATGIDIDKGFLDMSRKMYKNIHVHEMSVFDVHDLPEKFDTIVAIDVIEHIKDDTRALKAMSKKLSRQGRLIIVVPAHPGLYGIRDQYLGHYRRYSRVELAQKLEQVGLQAKYIRSWNAVSVLPYIIFEKLLHRPLKTELRTLQGDAPIFFSIFLRLINVWMKYIEGFLNLGFGLSLVCVAVKRSNETD